MNDDARQKLMVTRIMWAALVAGVILFAAVALSVAPKSAAVDRSLVSLLFYIALGLLVVEVAFGYVFRYVTYKRHSSERGVAPGAYFTGNLVLFACAEGGAMFGVVIMFLAGDLYPGGIVTLLGLLVLAMNFPTGGAMRGEEFQDLTKA